MPAWSLDRARHTYSIPYWSDGYFDVDAAGRMCALPRGAGGPVLPLPDILSKRLRKSPVSRWLAKAALAGMLHGEPTERPFGTRTIHLTQFFLLPGAGYKFAELGRQARVAAGIF